MLIYIMRHGQAQLHAQSDEARPLTQQGLRDVHYAALWLKTQTLSFDIALTSPYLRAQQTAEAIQAVVPAVQHALDSTLIPIGDETQAVDYLSYLCRQGVKSVLLVSHMPLVGELVRGLTHQPVSTVFATSDIVCIDAKMIHEQLTGKIVARYTKES